MLVEQGGTLSCGESQGTPPTPQGSQEIISKPQSQERGLLWTGRELFF